MGLLSKLNELLSPPVEKKRKRRTVAGADVREALVNLVPNIKEAMLAQLNIAQNCLDALAADLQGLDPGPAQDKLTRLLLNAATATTRFRNAVMMKEILEAKKAAKL